VVDEAARPPLSRLGELEAKCTCGEGDSKEGQRLCEVYKPEGLDSTRLVQGTGARVRRALGKAREGKAMKIGVLGGSGEFRHAWDR
jgi:hypothetical protein